MLHQAVYRHPAFAGIAQHYYAELVSRNPVLATWLGEHSFDGLLPEAGAEAVERNIAFLRELKTAFCTLPENDLSIDEQIDRQAVIHFAEQQLFLDEDLQRWRTGRDLAMNIGDALFLLFIRDFAPLSERVRSMISRLKAVPAFLMSGRTLFQKVSQEKGELCLESAAKLPAFLATIESSLHRHVIPDLQQEFSRAAANAAKAVDDYSHWLKQAIMPKAEKEQTLGMGPFQALVSSRRIGMTPTEITDLARQLFQEATRQLEALSCVILGESTGEAAGARIDAQKRVNRHAPTSFDQVLSVYRENLSRTRAFLEYSKFATLPADEELDIIETPAYMRHIITSSAYFAPERKSAVQRGFYLITRDESSLPARHNYAEIANSVIHRAYPGHHLHLATQNQHPGILRSFTDSAEMIEGWASYCQEAVREKGFETSSESLFVQALDKARAAALLKTEVRLQTRTWTREDAENFLVNQARFEKEAAKGEIRRIMQRPSLYSARLTGHHQLLLLKNELRTSFSHDFTDRSFHDLILYQGGIPVHLARQYFPQLMKQQLKSLNRV